MNEIVVSLSETNSMRRHTAVLGIGRTGIGVATVNAITAIERTGSPTEGDRDCRAILAVSHGTRQNSGRSAGLAGTAAGHAHPGGSA